MVEEKVRQCTKIGGEGDVGCGVEANVSGMGTVTGTLKGYDQLMNLVLDDVKELLRGMIFLATPSLLGVYLLPHLLILLVADDEGNESTRSLGLIVARGTLLVLISPLDGSEQIANPFNQQEED